MTASISSNVESAMVCSGEELILTCTGQGTSQRWHITANGAQSQIDINFLSVKATNLGHKSVGGYNFTLDLVYQQCMKTLYQLYQLWLQVQ